MTQMKYGLESDLRIARVTFDVPGPVNVIGAQFIAELYQATQRAMDDGAAGMILCSAKKKSFIDGANLMEIAKDPNLLRIRHLVLELHETLDGLAKAPFPVVAVLAGQTALGGGAEALMWACDHVFATHGSKIGLPEVNVGLFPAAGGTETLRRLVGLERMLDMVLAGRTLGAEQLVDCGLVSMTRPADALHEARQWILAHRGVKNRNHDPGREEPGRLDAASCRALLAKLRARHEACPERPWMKALLDQVEEGLDLPFDESVKRSVDRFASLLMDPNSRNKIDLFFTVTGVAPRLVKVDPARARRVAKLGVLGAGLMGQGIAQVSADAGIEVLLFDVDMERAKQGAASIGAALAALVKKGRWPQARMDSLMGRITPAVDHGLLADVPLVVESVFEDLDLKRKVLASVQEASLDIVFASNTSTLPMEEISRGAPRPEMVVGMHFFSPVPLMPLMEVIRGPLTSDQALATAVLTGRAQGKTVIVVGDGPGFYTSRTFGVFVLTGLYIAQMGMDPWEVDRIALAAGFPQGPLDVYGTAGGNVIFHAARAMADRMPDRISIPETLVRLHDAGYVGAGRPCFYGKGHEPDRSVLDLVAKDAGRTPPGAAEAREMLLLSMVNQAFLCVDEGVLADFASMDLGAILGVGFPDVWHGPARYVSQHGVRATRDRLHELFEKYRIPFFRPARTFDRLIACGVDSGLI